MHMTLVRHGETIENAQNIIQGQAPGHLSPLGLKQASESAELLANKHFDEIYCSDLQRCIDTLSAFQPSHPNVPTVITAALRERSGGNYQGKQFDAAYWQSLVGDEINRKYPGGESWLDVKHRIKPLLNEIFEKHATGSVLIITHGGVIRSIRSYLENRPLEYYMTQPLPNAGIWDVTMLSPLTNIES
ncbi:MAG: hypothetical protein NVS1B7_7890 [Candidatus Saccharimonadales bacterium]